MALPPGWYHVQQLGHHSLYGYAEEVEILGVTMLRVSIPATPDGETERLLLRGTPARTVTITAASLYALEETTEAVVMAHLLRERPVERLPMALPVPASVARVISGDTGADDSTEDEDDITPDDWR